MRRRFSLGGFGVSISVVALSGAAIGFISAWFAVRSMEGLIHGVEATGVGTLCYAVLALLTVALVACVISARRAAAVEPIVALRAE